MLMVRLGHGSDAESEREFRTVMAEHSNLISSICFSFSGNGVSFEDLRQDALINIWRGIRSYHGQSKMSTWIYRVTLNSCVSSMRRTGRDVCARESLDAIADKADVADEKVEQLEFLHELISRLNPTDRSIILMRLDERSYDEIAEVMGMNRNTVATRLSRIKQKLAVMVD